MISAFSLLIFTLLWEWVGRQSRMVTIAPPSKTIPAFFVLLRSAEIYEATLQTLYETFAGYFLAVVVGVSIGAATAWIPLVNHVLSPLVAAFNAAPLASMVPLIAIYVGFGIDGRIFIVFFWTVFVILTNTAVAIKTVPTNLIELGHAFNANRIALFRSIIVPAALPQLLGGLRLGIGRAFRGAIAAEMLLSVSNLGRAIKTANATFNIPALYARTIYIILLGLCLVAVAGLIEKRLLPGSKKWIRRQAVSAKTYTESGHDGG
jgi:ABC-type nitrate/sulfonate/bicarbonate transport system permease component